MMMHQEALINDVNPYTGGLFRVMGGPLGVIFTQDIYITPTTDENTLRGHSFAEIITKGLVCVLTIFQ